jgi:hypothetical protein
MGISSVTSEALQLKLRQLLPSQQGFGTDLSASDTIIPIIDLTASAEGSDVRADLQSAIAFGNATTISVVNTTNTVANTAGFYRLFGSLTIYDGSSSAQTVKIIINDGSSDKIVYEFGSIGANGTERFMNQVFDTNFYITSGESIKITCTATSKFSGSIRQIADNNGNLVQPIGFNPQ